MFWNVQRNGLTLYTRIQRILLSSTFQVCRRREKPLTCIILCPRCYSSSVFKNATVTSDKDNEVKPLFLVAEKYKNRQAVVDQYGSYTYGHLLHYGTELRNKILELHFKKSKILSKISKLAGMKDLGGERVAFLCENDLTYVVAQWGIWMAGGIAVPLCKSHPQTELQYFIEDSESKLVIANEKFESLLEPILNDSGVKLLKLEDKYCTNEISESENEWFCDQAISTKEKSAHSDIHRLYLEKLAKNEYKDEAAMIVYTSGTTGKPKGVLMTHGNLNAMMNGMIKAWEWKANDVVLHVLPLYHIHGIVNVLMTPLFCGATCVMLPHFDPAKVWHYLVDGLTSDSQKEIDVKINVFMAVPTIYAKLIEYFEKKIKIKIYGDILHNLVKSTCSQNIRLMVSGSDALPEPVMEKWKEITGHTLLERYGMTETGMVLTNPLKGDRIPGCVGHPFPSVEVCLGKLNVKAENNHDIIARGNSDGTVVTPGMEGEQGELLVQGPSVFKKYWNKPAETKAAFTSDGWFKTGDTVVYVNGVYKIVGRTSVDIIKSGGYKISALDIERHLKAHEDILDCAVVGLPDMTWGQRVAAVVVLEKGWEERLEEGSEKRSEEESEERLEKTMIEDLKSWASDRMPPYHIPSVFKILHTIPRNAMGKINKKTLVKEVFPEFNKKHM